MARDPDPSSAQSLSEVSSEVSSDASSAASRPDVDFFRDFARTRAYSLGRPTRIQITPDGAAVLFLRSPAHSPAHELYELEVASGRVHRLAGAGDLDPAPAELSVEEQARRERLRVTDTGLTSYQLSPDGSLVLLPYGGRLFLLERSGGGGRGAVRVVVDRQAEPPLDARFSPYGAWIAFVRAGDLYLQRLQPAGAGVAPVAITSSAGPGVFNGLAEFVAQEEMARHEGFWWSPASDRLLFTDVDEREVETFSIADPARPERPPVAFRYPRPGRANARVRLGLAALAGAGGPPPVTWVEWDQQSFPYLCRVLWEGPGAAPAVLVQSRDQREVVLLEIDQASGATRPLARDQDPAWVNLERDLPRFLPDGRTFLWASEGHHARTLELRGRGGGEARQLLGADSGFLSLCHVSGDGRQLFFLAGDAVANRLERLDLASGARTRVLGDGSPAEHAPIFSRQGGLLVDTCLLPGAMPESCVYHLGAEGVALAGPTLPAVAAEPPSPVRLEITETGGEPSFRAALVRPGDFVPGRRYPVVLHVYGGPHSLMVKPDARSFVLDQWIADQGVVVVCLDNRGTPRRGRAWERAIKGQLGEVPLADQTAGLEALARRYPELDLDRVGVYGWSFGGYLSALAVLRRPDLFKVAVAGAPVVDWRDYDTHYTERYLDLPERAPAAYQQASLIPHAAGLARPLLLVHGTADDNVYFFHSLKLAGALLGAGRPFDFLPLPGVTHQIADPGVREQLWRRVTGYLLDHLLPDRR